MEQRPSSINLTVRAVTAYVEGPARRAERVPDRVARAFGTAFLQRMSRSLTLPEISVILRAEKSREAGLALARAGSLEEATPLVAEARDAYTQAGLVGEACWAAETFQLAAESYLSYRRGSGAQARRDLYGSIELSIRLGTRGYRMDSRVLHLARNVVHVENALGSAALALAEAIGLALFLNGRLSAWPFAESPWTRLPSLDEPERLLARDELVGELERVRGRAQDAALAVKESDLDSLDPFLRDWVSVTNSYLTGDHARFLKFVIEYCSSCDAFMPQTRRAMCGYLIHCCRLEGREDLETELERA